MTRFHVLALSLTMLWLALVVLGLRGRRLGAAIVGGVVSVAAGFPFLPRLAEYLLDRDGFIATHGAWVVSEIRTSALCVTLALAGLVTAPLSPRHAWAWVLPALATLFPVALLAWLGFRFSLF